MNKKFLIFGVIGLFAVALVSAIAYYGFFAATFTVNQPIQITGTTEQTLDDVYSGDTIVGDDISVSNDAETPRDLSITDNSGDDVEVEYKSYLTLTEKTVDFSPDSPPWETPSDAEEVEIQYTLVGDSFSAEVIKNEKAGYELIYYKDNSDRFDNPAEAILIEYISDNLPFEDDGNAEEYDYCETGEYLTCFGAKIWYVPSEAINEDMTLDWSRADEFYFETKLIQYNSDGEITIYGGESLTITPEYTPSNYVEGSYTINTTIA